MKSWNLLRERESCYVVGEGGTHYSTGFKAGEFTNLTSWPNISPLFSNLSSNGLHKSTHCINTGRIFVTFLQCVFSNYSRLQGWRVYQFDHLTKCYSKTRPNCILTKLFANYKMRWSIVQNMIFCLTGPCNSHSPVHGSIWNVN